jgi:flagellar biosynthesis/type III secretory pathway protein FliH
MTEGEAIGRAEAIASAESAINALTAAWAGALSNFAEKRDRMLLDARHDVVRLACEIATRATGRVIDVDPSVVVSQMAEILELVAAGTRLRVRIHRDDEALLRDAMPGILARLDADVHVDLLVDASVNQGSCVALTERHGVIDASIETKLARLIAAILPNASDES